MGKQILDQNVNVPNFMHKLYVYIYLYIHTHTHTHTHIHTNTHTHIYISIYIYTQCLLYIFLFIYILFLFFLFIDGELYYICHKGTKQQTKVKVVCGAEQANTIFEEFHASSLGAHTGQKKHTKKRNISKILLAWHVKGH